MLCKQPLKVCFSNITAFPNTWRMYEKQNGVNEEWSNVLTFPLTLARTKLCCPVMRFPGKNITATKLIRLNCNRNRHKWQNPPRNDPWDHGSVWRKCPKSDTEPVLIRAPNLQVLSLQIVPDKQEQQLQISSLMNMPNHGEQYWEKISFFFFWNRKGKSKPEYYLPTGREGEAASSRSQV